MKDEINQRNQIYFGICIEEIKDDSGQMLFEEESRAHFSVRPWGLVNGQETEARVRKLAKLIDKEIGDCRTRVIKYGGVDITVNCSFHPCIDGKLIREYDPFIFGLVFLSIILFFHAPYQPSFTFPITTRFL